MQLLLLVVFLVSTLSFSQKFKIYGTVYDENQNSISNALVLIKNTNDKVFTDFNGKYEFNISLLLTMLWKSGLISLI